MKGLLRAACGLGLCALSQGCPAKDDAPEPKWIAADWGNYRCMAINSNRQVVAIKGASDTVLLDASGGVMPLPNTEPSGISVGTAINEAGEVVGYTEGKRGRTAARYSGGKWESIADGATSWTTAIGAAGSKVVGVGGTGKRGEMRAFIRGASGREGLPVPADRGSAAYLLTEKGDVSGIVESPSGDTHAFRVLGGAFSDLGTLGGTNSTPHGMNSAGDVVGSSERANAKARAFLAAANGSPMMDVDSPDSALESDARGIDDKGRIAGNRYDASGHSQPMLFQPGRAPIDLTPVDADQKRFLSTHVVGMSRSGVIVGYGYRDHPVDAAPHCLVWALEGER